MLTTIRAAALARNRYWTAAAWLLERKYPDECRMHWYGEDEVMARRNATRLRRAVAPWAAAAGGLLARDLLGTFAKGFLGIHALDLLALLFLIHMARRAKSQLVTRVDSVGTEKGGAYGEKAGPTWMGVAGVGGDGRLAWDFGRGSGGIGTTPVC